MNTLKILREQKGLTQKALAELIKIPRITYYRIESGKYEADYSTLKKLSKFYNVSINYILNEPDENIVVMSRLQFVKFKEIADIIYQIDHTNKNKDNKQQNEIKIKDNHGEQYNAINLTVNKKD